jgi:competence protein ComEC
MAELKVHFLNVGHGDCIVIHSPSGRLSIIDINNGCCLDDDSYGEIAADYSVGLLERTMGVANRSMRGRILAERGYDVKLTNPIEFLQQNYPYKPIWRYIQTHPHMDHMRGLSALQNANIDITNFWDTEHSVVPELDDEDKQDWDEYQLLRSGNRGNRVLRLCRGNTGVFWNEDPEGIPPGDGIEILHPPRGGNTSSDSGDNPNNLSYILKLSYRGIIFIFGGDAEEPVWNEVATEYGSQLKCTVLKASHHGRESGYCQDAVKLMSPEYTIVSVGKKPESDASNKYRLYSQHVWSTRWLGDIAVTVPEHGSPSIVPQYQREPQ